MAEKVPKMKWSRVIMNLEGIIVLDSSFDILPPGGNLIGI